MQYSIYVAHNYKHKFNHITITIHITLTILLSFRTDEKLIP